MRAEIGIVGAGPAGAWAAYRLARAGARVAIIDGSHPREKPCGGGLTGRALDLIVERSIRVRFRASRSQARSSSTATVACPCVCAATRRPRRSRSLHGATSTPRCCSAAVGAGATHVAPACARRRAQR